MCRECPGQKEKQRLPSGSRPYRGFYRVIKFTKKIKKLFVVFDFFDINMGTGFAYPDTEKKNQLIRGGHNGETIAGRDTP
jgi:hypothetical protein